MTTIAGLTPARVATLEAVIALTTEHGTPPTYHHIAERRGLAVSSVGLHLAVLQSRGWVRLAWVTRPAGTPGRTAVVVRTDKVWPPRADTTTESAAAA